MATTYSAAGDDVVALLAGVMKDSHDDLHAAGVRVGVLMAENPDGDAVKRGGYAVLAMIKPVPLKDRLTKGFDAELVIDLRGWNGLSREGRPALLDHELSHLAVVKLKPKELARLRHDDPNAPWWKTDDLGRPRLRSVPGDWNAGDGFKAVVERHGRSTVEFLNLDSCYSRAKAAVAG